VTSRDFGQMQQLLAAAGSDLKRLKELEHELKQRQTPWALQLLERVRTAMKQVQSGVTNGAAAGTPVQVTAVQPPKEPLPGGNAAASSPPGGTVPPPKPAASSGARAARRFTVPRGAMTASGGSPSSASGPSRQSASAPLMPRASAPAPIPNAAPLQTTRASPVSASIGTSAKSAVPHAATAPSTVAPAAPPARMVSQAAAPPNTSAAALKAAQLSTPPLTLEEAYKVLKATARSRWEDIERVRCQLVWPSNPEHIQSLGLQKQIEALAQAQRANEAYVVLARARLLVQAQAINGSISPPISEVSVHPTP
jgi:hypothetical protein